MPVEPQKGMPSGGSYVAARVHEAAFASYAAKAAQNTLFMPGWGPARPLLHVAGGLVTGVSEKYDVPLSECIAGGEGSRDSE